MTSASDLLAPTVSQLVQLIVALVLEQLRDERTSDPEEWVPHRQSPLGPRKTRALIRRGDLSGHKVGKLLLVRRCEIDAYIERHKVVARTALVQTGGSKDGVDAVLREVGLRRPRSRARDAKHSR